MAAVGLQRRNHRAHDPLQHGWLGNGCAQVCANDRDVPILGLYAVGEVANVSATTIVSERNRCWMV